MQGYLAAEKRSSPRCSTRWCTPCSESSVAGDTCAPLYQESSTDKGLLAMVRIGGQWCAPCRRWRGGISDLAFAPFAASLGRHFEVEVEGVCREYEEDFRVVGLDIRTYLALDAPSEDSVDGDGKNQWRL